MSETKNNTPSGNGEQKDLKLEVLPLKKAALLLKAINHPLRQRMLQVLHQHEGINVTDLYQKLRLEQSIASQHLSVLRRANIVCAKRRSRYIHYFVNYEQLKKLQQQAKALIG